MTEFAARVKLRRGLRQAFIRSCGRCRGGCAAGSRVRVRLNLQVVRGPRITRSLPAADPGLGPLVAWCWPRAFTGHDVDDPESDLFGALLETITDRWRRGGRRRGRPRRALDEGRARSRPRRRPLRRRDGAPRRPAPVRATATPDLRTRPRVGHCARPPLARPRGVRSGACHRSVTPPLSQHLRQARRAPALEGREGAPAAGDRLRGRQGPAAARQARRARGVSAGSASIP